MRVFRVGNRAVHAIVYSADGQYLVTDVRADPSGHPEYPTIQVRPCRELVWWDWATGTESHRFRLRDSLFGVNGVLADTDDPEDRSPDEPSLDVAVTPDGLVATVWEWTNKEDGVAGYSVPDRKGVFLSTPYKTHVERLAFAADGKTLAAATVHDMDGSSFFEVWAVGQMTAGEVGWDGFRERAVENPFTVLGELHFDGRHLTAVGEGDPMVLLWDTADPASPKVRRCDVGFAPVCLAATAAGFVAGGERLVVVERSTLEPRAAARTGPGVTAVAVSPDGRTIAVGTADGTVEFWPTDSLDAPTSTMCLGPEAISAVAFAPDGLTCAAGRADGHVVVWDVGS